MVDKGEKLAVVEFVTRRAESHVNDVNNQIWLGNTSVKKGQDVVVELYKDDSQGNYEHLSDYRTGVFKTSKRVTLKADVVKRHNIKPGQKHRAVIYEATGSDGQESLSDISGLSNEPDVEEKIDEIHSMLKDIHAYAKNDD